MRTAGQRKAAWGAIVTGDGVLAFVVWEVATFLNAPNWVRIASAGAAVATIPLVALRQEREKRRKDRAGRERVLSDHLRFWDLPEGRLNRVREVGALSLGVTPAQTWRNGDLPPYVPRPEDDEIDRALRDTRFVLLVGESKTGKTRAAFEGARKVFPERHIVVPEKRESLTTVLTLDPPLDLGEAVVWLDNLETYLGPEGLSVKLLDSLERSEVPVTLVGTIRSSEHERYGPASGVARPIRDVLDRAHSIRLRPVQDADRVRRAYESVDEGFLHEIERYGLGACLVAGPDLVHKFENASNRDGVAIVRAAIDWRRVGLARPTPEPALRELYPLYVAQGREASDEGFAEGLAWAREEIYSSAALLTLKEQGPPRTFEVSGYLVDRQTGRVPDAAWDVLIRHAEPEEQLVVGIAAYAQDSMDAARAAFEVAAAAGLPEGIYNVGLMREEAGETAEASEYFEKAAATRPKGHTTSHSVLTEELDADTVLVALVGELDLYTASEIRQALLETIAGDFRALVLDMSKVTFLDSSGLGVLVGMFKRVTRAGGRMTIVRPESEVARIFKLTGLDHALELYDTRAEAIARAREAL